MLTVPVSDKGPDLIWYLNKKGTLLFIFPVFPYLYITRKYF